MTASTIMLFLLFIPVYAIIFIFVGSIAWNLFCVIFALATRLFFGFLISIFTATICLMYFFLK